MNMRARSVVLIFAVVAVLALIPTLSARLTDMLSGEITVSAKNGDHGEQLVVADGDNGAVVVWTSTAGKNSSLYAQRYDKTGRPLWTGGGRKLGNVKGRIADPSAAADGEHVYVGWSQTRNKQADLYVQKIALSGGFPWGDRPRLLAGGRGDQASVKLAVDHRNGVFAAYLDFNSTPRRLIVQYLDEDGLARWGKGTIVAHESAASNPFLIAGRQGLTVAWEQQTGDLTFDIFAQRYDLDGRRLWAAGNVPLIVAPGDQQDVRLAHDGDGGVFAAWEDHRAQTTKTYAQRLSAAGEPRWSTTGVGVADAKGAQWHPEIQAINDKRDLIVTWKDLRRDHDDVYAQKLTGAGRKAWRKTGLIISGAPGDQEFIKTASSSAKVYIVWSDGRRVGNDVYMQAVDADGRLSYQKDGRPVARAEGEQQDPAIAVSGERAFVVWSDYRAGRDGPDIFARALK